MARVYQVPHHAFGWLCTGVFLAGMPHLWRGPVWLMALLPAAVIWRLLVQRGVLRLPGRTMRALLMAGAIIGTLYSFGTLLGPDAGTCLLVSAFALKLLESFRVRDAYVTIVFGYFVVATTFLFYQNPVLAAYVVISMVVLTAALIGINHLENSGKSRRHLGLSAVMMGQAIPLMIIFFIFVPRLPPLWSMQVDGGQSRTGMSDSMAPGEITRLSQSDELVLRAEFESQLPPPALRYWRGLTYSWFDGQRWSQAVPRSLDTLDYVWYPRDPEPDWYKTLQQAALSRVHGEEPPVYQYRVIMEPTQRSWLYAIAVPFAAGQRNIGLARDFRLVSDDEVDQRISYRVSSDLPARRAMDLPDWEREFNLRLPTRGNQQSRELALQWRDEANSAEDYAQRVLNWFRDEAFFYTLEPPRLGANSVDEFLFESRRGFCEHYASAFAYMMRAAGIPARIVAGYQGGEVNPVGNHITVRQYDAHAWTEIWLDDAGWVEIDPTASVAPERIEMGLERALSEEDRALRDTLFGMEWARNNEMLQQMRFMADYVQFAWQRWVIGYDERTQFEFLRRWLGDYSPLKLAMVLAVGFTVIVLVLALWIVWLQRGKPHGPLYAEYRYFARWLSRHGVEVKTGETVGTLAHRGMAQLPRRQKAIAQWYQIFERLAYDPDSDEQNARRQLRQARKQLKRG